MLESEAILEQLRNTTLMVLILAGTYFCGNRIDHISRVFIFADLPLEC